MDMHSVISCSTLLASLGINSPSVTGNLMKHFVFLPHLRLAVLQTFSTHSVELVVELIGDEIVNGNVTSLA